MSVRLLIAGALAAVLGGVLAVTVAAHTDRYPTDIEITAGGSDSYVYGGVESQRPSCEPDRKVELYRKKPGKDRLIDSTKSIPNTGGVTWTIELNSAPPTGNYYSKARKRDLAPGGGHAHICREASSDLVPLGP